MTIVRIEQKHTEEPAEKKEKKCSSSGSSEIGDLFDGTDADLRIAIVLGR